MASHTCPFCGITFPIIGETKTEYLSSFDSCSHTVGSANNYAPVIRTTFFFCPSCEKTHILVNGYNGDIKGVLIGAYPSSKAKVFPDYVPVAILSDYKEACDIVNRSPKAAATLSRRCLQGMIRDRWGIVKKKID